MEQSRNPSKTPLIDRRKRDVWFGIAALALLTTAWAYGLANFNKRSYTDKIQSSVTVTTLSERSGGSGVIIDSSETSSIVLTNNHVCEAIRSGGLVKSLEESYTVTSFKQSTLHDLCLIEVNGDLHGRTKLADRRPKSYYEEASISGHPQLYPDVITKGHYSGRQVVNVTMGTVPCDLSDMSAACQIFHVKTLEKTFETQLVTATIMPGSSGSGVYNSNDELTNLVFAGSGELSYALTVPYEYVYNFLTKERFNLDPQYPSSEPPQQDSMQSSLADIKEICKTLSVSDPEVYKICKLASQNTFFWNE